MARVLLWGMVLTLTGLVIPCGTASAGLDFEEGSWRLELRGMRGIYQGALDRSADRAYLLGAEYEVPVTRHGTLGFRLLPLFVYDADDGEDPVLGAGVGLAFRLYMRGERHGYRGLFLEAEADALLLEDRIPGNSSSVNFLLGGGLGYQFNAHWSTTLRYQHISNASLGDDNTGANAVGIGLAFRF